MTLFLLRIPRASEYVTFLNIGFAAAKKKTIWAICLERELQPKGMISNLNSYSLFDRNNPDEVIGKLISKLRDGVTDSELDLAINGKLVRTKFLVEKLGDILRTIRATEDLPPISIFNLRGFGRKPVSEGRGSR